MQLDVIKKLADDIATKADDRIGFQQIYWRPAIAELARMVSSLCDHSSELEREVERLRDAAPYDPRERC